MACELESLLAKADELSMEITVAETEVDILAHALQRMRSEGVCRGDITALEGIAPALVNRIHPIMSYTQRPSTTNLSPAMEGILETIQSMFLKAVGKVIELVGRLVGWITRQFRRGFERSIGRQVDRNIEHAVKVLKPAVASKDQDAIDDLFDSRRYNAVASSRLHEVLEDNIQRVPPSKPILAALEDYRKATEGIINFLEEDLIVLNRSKNTAEYRKMHFYPTGDWRTHINVLWSANAFTDSWWWLLSHDTEPQSPRMADQSSKRSDDQVVLLRGDIPHPGLTDTNRLSATIKRLAAAPRRNPRLADGALKAVIKGEYKAEEIRDVVDRVAEMMERFEDSNKRLKRAHDKIAQEGIRITPDSQIDIINNLRDMLLGGTRLGLNCMRTLANGMVIHGGIANSLMDIHKAYKASRV